MSEEFSSLVDPSNQGSPVPIAIGSEIQELLNFVRSFSTKSGYFYMFSINLADFIFLTWISNFLAWEKSQQREKVSSRRLSG